MENQRGGQNANTHPPHKCARTQEQGVCLKFYPNANGHYVLPPGGERVNCTECLYFFE
jgi:hypothetical protein